MKYNKLTGKLGFTPVLPHTERLACGDKDKITLEILMMQGLSRLFRIYPVSKILLMLCDKVDENAPSLTTCPLSYILHNTPCFIYISLFCYNLPLLA